ncbi:MAG: SUMF1/EgtB/PvdO family nonheme iron enzyme [Polyangiales bacterium]
MLQGARLRIWGILAALSVGAVTVTADAQPRRRARCVQPQHESAGRCCDAGAEWVEARNRCVCLDPSVCGDGAQAQPPAPQPPPPQPPPQAVIEPPLPPPQLPPPPPVQPAQPAAGAMTCPEGMVMIEPRPFMMGAQPGRGGATAAEGPPHRVTLSPYCIDRTEVTVARYRECVQSGACTVYSTVNFPGLSIADAQFFSQYCNGARSDRDRHPMNCVDYNQAAAFCRAQGGSLPTEAQWELAARGLEPRSYPWDDRAPGGQLVNGCDAECQTLMERPGQPRRPALFLGSDGYGSTSPVGTYVGGQSPFGILDASGNVAEWVSDWFGAYSAAPATDPTGPQSGTGRVTRGGHWFANTANQFTTTTRAPAAPTVRLATLGLRCAHAPIAAPPPPPPPEVEEPPAPEPPRRHRRRH